MITENTQHHVSVGRLLNGKLNNEKQIGTSFYEGDGTKPYFKICLWQYPGQPYYLVKNRDNRNYTVFSKMTDSDEESPIFQCPVGYGYLTEDFKEALQVQFNFPWQKCFISLHPENKGV